MVLSCFRSVRNPCTSAAKKLSCVLILRVLRVLLFSFVLQDLISDERYISGSSDIVHAHDMCPG